MFRPPAVWHEYVQSPVIGRYRFQFYPVSWLAKVLSLLRNQKTNGELWDIFVSVCDVSSLIIVIKCAVFWLQHNRGKTPSWQWCYAKRRWTCKWIIQPVKSQLSERRLLLVNRYLWSRWSQPIEFTLASPGHKRRRQGPNVNNVACTRLSSCFYSMTSTPLHERCERSSWLVFWMCSLYCVMCVILCYFLGGE